MRVLWKYVSYDRKEVHFSWERWENPRGYWEFRLPKEEE
jgi:hypothetical protein